ncbi:CgeB family protein [Sphingobacterium multivorum]|uniref:CgeB family protein n=1 Tax=Sphingobacterium multivorum TaxID=28454 RepID=UPI000E91EF50|nr:glycosyltransferase [Sphingobacterium multivorum]QQT63621.1 glycosyltransferase [Sphingobacterium multivorum]HBI87701.1 glycosyltransferase [Sphingobacterium sp.]
MKIVIIGSKNFDSLEYHVNDSLKHLGHEVYQVDITDVIKIPYRYSYWIQKFSSSLDDIVFKKIADKVIALSPDLVISTYRNVNPITIKNIRKYLTNTKIVQLNPDAVTTFGDQQIFASPYDVYFTKDPFILDFMENKMGLKSFYLPEAFNHRIHKPPILTDRQQLENSIATDVVAFGTMYPYRSNVLKHLVNNGINLDLYGTSGRKFNMPEIQSRFKNEYITGQRKAEVLYGSKIVFNNFHYAEVECVNVKFFEIMGIGAFQICDYKSVINDLCNVPAEKFTFQNIDEGIEKIRYYLDRPIERHTIAQQQLEHFLNNHTYDIRMQEMLNLIF